jgi:hypothetical protein
MKLMVDIELQDDGEGEDEYVVTLDCLACMEPHVFVRKMSCSMPEEIADEVQAYLTRANFIKKH